MMMKPFRKQDIFVWNIGRETVLYRAEAKVFHLLNPTARVILELCDGEHTVEDMEQEIKARFSTSHENDVVGDIQQIIELFAVKGILEKIVVNRHCKCAESCRCFH